MRKMRVPEKIMLTLMDTALMVILLPIGLIVAFFCGGAELINLYIDHVRRIWDGRID